MLHATFFSYHLSERVSFLLLLFFFNCFLATMSLLLRHCFCYRNLILYDSLFFVLFFFFCIRLLWTSLRAVTTRHSTASIEGWFLGFKYGPCSLCSPPAFCLWKNFSQRISLIREVRKCRNKGR